MFDERAQEEEFLDRPDCDPELAALSYRFMEMINRHFGGIRVVRRFLAAEAAKRAPGLPLRILDIGSGSCDIPLALSRWGRAHALPLDFTCLELAGPAARIAQAKLEQAGDPAVRLLHEDVFAHQPAEPYDYAVASMCFHHFTHEQILALVQKLRGFVREAVLINDLRRSVLASLGARLLLAVSPSGLRHDALLSIRRGFKVPELRAGLSRLDHVSVSVEPARWFRIAAVVRYIQRGSS